MACLMHELVVPLGCLLSQSPSILLSLPKNNLKSPSLMAGGAGARPGLTCVGVGLLRHTNNTAPHQQETHTEEFSTFLHQHSIKDPTLSNSA